VSVDEIKPGHFVWFADMTGLGYREAVCVDPFTAHPDSFNAALARDWVTVTYADGHVHEHVRYGGHDVWESGDRLLVGEVSP
jgi:prepilin-type processing-associated H-X9-DG protein